jgi:hypothetical protein
VLVLGMIQPCLFLGTACDKSRVVSQRGLFSKKVLVLGGLAGLVRDPHSSVPDSNDPC